MVKGLSHGDHAERITLYVTQVGHDSSDTIEGDMREATHRINALVVAYIHGFDDYAIEARVHR